MTTAFVPRESREGETRVAVTPDTAKRLLRAGLQLHVERGAGTAAGFPDPAYEAVGATIVDGSVPEVAWGTELVIKVQPPAIDEVPRLREGGTLVCVMQPSAHHDVVQALLARRTTTLAMDLVPRITRAQSMDVLSSQATVAGYKAVLLGASALPKLCPLLMTAAGTVPPAKVVVFGAGVAGLTAIATARRLGCVVEATDVRLAAKEQVESLGATFIDVPGAEDMEGSGGYAKEQSAEFLQRQREEVKKRVLEADLVITTALIPGRKAPVLVDAETVREMQPGSVIVDLAVETGGNCEASEVGRTVQRDGVTIIGIPNLPATVPYHASELYAKNVFNLLKPFVGEGGTVALDFDDEVVQGCRLTHAGEVWHAPTAEAMGRSVPAPPVAAPPAEPTASASASADAETKDEGAAAEESSS